MFLDKLIILDYAGNEIRKVQFNPNGLNLVVGINNDKGSTNNIGKTTLIRCLDFCFKGKLEQLYVDKEFKTSINEEVYNFFKTKQPIFKVILIDNSADRVYTISREVSYDEKSKFTIDNKILINEEPIKGDFEENLKKILFNSNVEKPTLRQLLPKFIRKDEEQISNVLKYLHVTTTYSAYEKIHLFLFGFNAKALLQTKSELEKSLAKKKKSKTALGSRFNVTDLKQILEITKKDLEKLYKERDGFKLNRKYEIEEAELKSLQLKIFKIEKKISNLQLKKSITSNKLKELEDGVFTNDTQTLKLLYDEASFYTKELHKSFDDVVNFHNSMLHNEIEYTQNKIVSIESTLKDFIDIRTKLSTSYSILMQKLSKVGSLAEYTKLNEQIENLVEKKGQDEKLLNELSSLEDEIDKIEDEIKDIKVKLESNLNDFDEKLAIFNESFSQYSKALYDQEFFVSYDRKDEPLKFYTKNVGGNEGSGKKQAIVSAFDLAFIDFVNTLNLNFPKFVAHDKVELIDINKLKSLFEISDSINGQFIIPIIYDKISDIYDEYKTNGNIILELSEDNKFFRI